MSYTVNEMSPADFRACTCGNDNNSGWGGNWSEWIILFLIFGMFGFGGFGGFGGGFGGGYGANNPGIQGMATRADINEGFALNNITGGITAIQQGICDSTYAINNTLQTGFRGVDNAVCNLGNQMQQGFNTTNVALMQNQNALSAQLAQCCCDNREAIAGVRYDMATQACDTRNAIYNSTRDIVDSNNAGTQAILGKLSQMEYNSLNDKYQATLAENQSLKFAASQSAQNAFITANQEAQTAELIRRLGRDCPVPAYVVPNPNCCYGNPVGVNYGGCNTNCSGF